MLVPQVDYTSRDAPATDGAPSSGTPAPRLRAVYRDARGEIHFDWPTQQLREAIADASGTLWLDIESASIHGDPAIEALLRDVFGFHPLAIEDALVETHLPKVDDWGDYLYIVFQSIDTTSQGRELALRELDIFLGKNYLVTYHAQPLKFLEEDRRNIERDPDNRLKHGPDHLLYHFLDLAVSGLFEVIEDLDEAIDRAQEEVFHRPTPRTLQSIFRVKQSTLRLHRIISPERELMNRLARDSYASIREEHRVYFRDVYDHLVRTHDLTETLRDLISSALDTYLSAISNRTNDIMKALTVVTVMFLPMSFITGFFGMNFFADNITFHAPLPKTLLFIVSNVLMIVGFIAPWIMAWRKKWL